MLCECVLLLLLVKLSTGLLPAAGSWDPVQYIQDDYVSVSYPLNGAKPKLFSYAQNSTVASTGRLYTIYVALLQSDILSSFSLELPHQGTARTCSVLSS